MSKINFLIVITILALLGVQFWLTSIHSASGREISDVLTRISEVKSQNNQLQMAIWQKSSLASISESADKLHFVQSSPIVLAPLSTALAP